MEPLDIAVDLQVSDEFVDYTTFSRDTHVNTNGSDTFINAPGVGRRVV